MRAYSLPEENHARLTYPDQSMRAYILLKVKHART
jgi:hypothetical protein